MLVEMKFIVQCYSKVFKAVDCFNCLVIVNNDNNGDKGYLRWNKLRKYIQLNPIRSRQIWKHHVYTSLYEYENLCPIAKGVRSTEKY